ncbi:DUF4845 domain-containing protein [Neptuniibacter sp.]|uniref:DUF4845 domain-containing protein n=1 Tax=Neptuniibacter sp. TaxID=1962643 RepID=UPI002632C949|nr:DUF4845 domain-containing protein [Neptuniibacter sp.]MCP4598883.1 DUF4845 domain-containing protein [Neptuniibacter sp.]
MRSTRKQQQGATFFSILIVLIVAGIFFSVAFKLYPAYTDNLTIDSVLTEVMNDREELAKGPSGMKRDITKKFRINQVKLPSKDSLKITRDKGIIRMDLKYEVRIPMFYNVDAMVKFEKQYEAIAP